MWAVHGKDAQIELAAINFARDTTVMTNGVRKDVNEGTPRDDGNATISIYSGVEGAVLLTEVEWNFSPATLGNNKDINASSGEKM